VPLACSRQRPERPACLAGRRDSTLRRRGGRTFGQRPLDRGRDTRRIGDLPHRDVPSRGPNPRRPSAGGLHSAGPRSRPDPHPGRQPFQLRSAEGHRRPALRRPALRRHKGGWHPRRAAGLRQLGQPGLRARWRCADVQRPEHVLAQQRLHPHRGDGATGRREQPAGPLHKQRFWPPLAGQRSLRPRWTGLFFHRRPGRTAAPRCPE
jgi:hypothetical protein